MIILITALGVLFGMTLALLFVILLDRKILASVQGREGPVISGFYGLFQAPIDGMKIFLKTIVFSRLSGKVIFFFSPVLVFFISTVGWILIPLSDLSGSFDMDYDFIAILILMAFGVLGFILAAWSAFSSKFPTLGAVREIAQMLAYELIVGFVFLVLVLHISSLSLRVCAHAQTIQWFLLVLTPVAFLFFVVILAELHRTPFDLSEAEAELTAGYQSEHGGSAFSAFFLAEYNNLLVFSLIFVISFMGAWQRPLLGGDNSGNILAFKTAFIVFFCVLIRGALPRTRISTFLNTAWSSIVPSSVNTLLFYIWLVFIFQAALPGPFAFDDDWANFAVGALAFFSLGYWSVMTHPKMERNVTVDASAAAMMDFASPHEDTEQTYLVAEKAVDSPMRTLVDVRYPADVTSDQFWSLYSGEKNFVSGSMLRSANRELELWNSDQPSQLISKSVEATKAALAKDLLGVGRNTLLLKYLNPDLISYVPHAPLYSSQSVLDDNGAVSSTTYHGPSVYYGPRFTMAAPILFDNTLEILSVLGYGGERETAHFLDWAESDTGLSALHGTIDINAFRKALVPTIEYDKATRSEVICDTSPEVFGPSIDRMTVSGGRKCVPSFKTRESQDFIYHRDVDYGEWVLVEDTTAESESMLRACHWIG